MDASDGHSISVVLHGGEAGCGFGLPGCHRECLARGVEVKVAAGRPGFLQGSGSPPLGLCRAHRLGRLAGFFGEAGIGVEDPKVGSFKHL